MLAVAKGNGMDYGATPTQAEDDSSVVSALLALGAARSGARCFPDQPALTPPQAGDYNPGRPSLQASLPYRYFDFAMGSYMLPVAVALHQPPKVSSKAIRDKPRDGLLDMPTTEFNRYLKLSHLTPEETQQLRKERRRKKNRLYAKRSRGKKLQRMLDEETHDATEAISPTIKIEIPELHPGRAKAFIAVAQL